MYDTLSNEIIGVDEQTYALALQAYSADTQPGERLSKTYSDLLARGSLSHTPFQAMCPSCPSCQKRAQQRELGQVTLEVTADCNLRCRYCIYTVSGAGPGFRAHGTRSMDIETALRGVDYLAANSADNKIPALGFYGGEPFLNFDVIRDAVSYARSKIGDKLLVSITTNGTVISTVIAQWCADNEVNLLVSLDGAKNEHNTNRRFLGGVGTWERVMCGLRCLAEVAPEYYAKRVGISCVLAQNISPLAVRVFFEESELLRVLERDSISISLDNAASFRQLHSQYLGFWDEMRVLQQEFVRAVLSGKVREKRFRFVKSLFQGPMLRLYKRTTYSPPFPRELPTNGMCIPGGRKVFVAADGILHCCERVGTAQPIGHLARGLSEDLIDTLLSKYCSASDGCLSCWAARLCTCCITSRSLSNSNITTSGSAPDCNAMRRSLISDLTLYCNILEAEPTAFDYMEHIVVS